MCNCISMVRVPDVETHDGRYPMPKHAKDCEDFKQVRFVRLKHDSATCLMEVNEAKDLQEFGAVVYEAEDVLLTRDQFDKMPEYAGF